MKASVVRSIATENAVVLQAMVRSSQRHSMQRDEYRLVDATEEDQPSFVLPAFRSVVGNACRN